MKKQSSQPKTPTRYALRDVIGGDRDNNGNLVDAIPPERFGKGPARGFRKMVLIAIAKNANADGTNAYPSHETIAHRCLIKPRAVRRHIVWLVDNGLLAVESKAVATSEKGRTNRYTILFPTEVTPGTDRPGVASDTPGTEGPGVPAEHPVSGTITPGLTGHNTRSAEAQHLVPALTYDSPIDSPIESTKERKEGKSSFSLSTSKTSHSHNAETVDRIKVDGDPTGDPTLAAEFGSWIGQGGTVKDFKPSNPSAWVKHRSARIVLYDSYLLWVMTKWARLSLTVPQTIQIRHFFLGYAGSNSDLLISTVPLSPKDYSGNTPGFWEQPTALQEATCAMLDGIDLQDSFAHAASKLVASLPSKFAAAHNKHAKRAEETRRMRGPIAADKAEWAAQREYEEWDNDFPNGDGSPFVPSYVPAFERYQLKQEYKTLRYGSPEHTALREKHDALIAGLSETEIDAELAYVKTRELVEEAARVRRDAEYAATHSPRGAEEKIWKISKPENTEPEDAEENTDEECYDCGSPLSEVVGLLDIDGNAASACFECEEMADKWGDSVLFTMSEARWKAKKRNQPWDKKEWLANNPPETFHPPDWIKDHLLSSPPPDCGPAAE
jgi:hypothetical protein